MKRQKPLPIEQHKTLRVSSNSESKTFGAELVSMTEVAIYLGVEVCACLFSNHCGGALVCLLQVQPKKDIRDETEKKRSVYLVLPFLPLLLACSLLVL